ncbi:hypothetical protein B0A54_00569 [Friedmanniomyces endolithicus]|uniref:Cytochrome b5 heme-binding domain-containing protein n=1 Tax=Friedmanniomyces endolithicus TaxID=329885 RepID=A0A4U0VH42_9PEZI|nr:hypothetical protein LTS09_002396 [Friedmanniomyces endolithicus]TKA48434.1 hypothetical protein B0A54_00569 [Friedmanniomyces endolithicus]
MGRLRASAFRSCHDDSRGEKLTTSFQQTKGEKSQRAQHAENVGIIERLAQHTDVYLEDSGYPILPKRTAAKDLPFIPTEEVAQRDGKGGNRLWIVVDTIILDATEYQEKHPGGRQIISGFGGRDCSWQVRRKPMSREGTSPKWLTRSWVRSGGPSILAASGTL